MFLKFLNIIMTFWGIVTIFVCSYCIYDLWFLSFNLSIKNTNNFIVSIFVTLLNLTFIIFIIGTLIESWRELKQ